MASEQSPGSHGSESGRISCGVVAGWHVVEYWRFSGFVVALVIWWRCQWLPCVIADSSAVAVSNGVVLQYAAEQERSLHAGHGECGELCGALGGDVPFGKAASATIRS